VQKSSKPEFTETDLSKPFRASLRLFKPRKNPNPQTNLKNKPKTQTVFSDRGGIEENRTSEQQTANSKTANNNQSYQFASANQQNKI
jgi:hypothetical protein